MKNQLIKNIGSNYLSMAVGMLLGLFLIPFLIQKLGKEAFGILVLAESAIAFFEVGTVGLRMALARHAAFALARGDFKKFSEYLSTGRGILFFVAGLVFLLSSAVSLYFPVLFNVPLALASQSRTLFFLISVAFAISIPNIVYWSILYAKHRLDLINASLFSGFVFRAAGLLVLFSFLPRRYVSLATYGLVYLMMMVLQNQLIYFWQRAVLPVSPIRLAEFKIGRVKDILSFGFHTSVSRAGFLLSGNFLDVLINLFWGAAFNAFYSIGLKFSMLMSRFFQDATWTLTPSFTELAAKHEPERLRRLLFFYTKILTVLVVPLGLVIAWMAHPLIRLWAGEGFESSGQILMISSVSLVTAIPFAAIGCVTAAYGKVKVPSRVSLLVAISNVGLAVLLGKGFSMGLAGFAIASATASIVYYAAFLPFYVSRITPISLGEYWVSAYFKPFIWSAVVVGTSFFLLNLSGHGRPASVSGVVFLFITVPLICYASAYRIVLNEKERAIIQDILRQVILGLASFHKKKIFQATEIL